MRSFIPGIGMRVHPHRGHSCGILLLLLMCASRRDNVMSDNPNRRRTPKESSSNITQSLRTVAFSVCSISL